jgi:type IV pilus assembly protein PilO
MGFMERLEAIPTLYRWLIVLGLLIVLGIAYWYLLYQPRMEELATLQEQINSKKTDLLKHQQIASKHEAFKAEVAVLEAHLSQLLQFLPKSQEIPDLIRQISDLAVRTGLQINLLRPQGEQPEQFYAKVPITVQVKGPYHAVGQFLDALGRLPRIVSVSDIDMKGASKETQGLATTYRYIEEGEAHDGAPSDTKKDAKKSGKKL